MNLQNEFARQVEQSLIRARHAFEAEIQNTNTRQKRLAIERITQVRSKLLKSFLCKACNKNRRTLLCAVCTITAKIWFHILQPLDVKCRATGFGNLTSGSNSLSYMVFVTALVSLVININNRLAVLFQLQNKKVYGSVGAIYMKIFVSASTTITIITTIWRSTLEAAVTALQISIKMWETISTSCFHQVKIKNK